ncbi:hypothetical protein K370107A2_07260 [Merdimmobilis hominis]
MVKIAAAISVVIKRFTKIPPFYEKGFPLLWWKGVVSYMVGKNRPIASRRISQKEGPSVGDLDQWP